MSVAQKIVVYFSVTAVLVGVSLLLYFHLPSWSTLYDWIEVIGIGGTAIFATLLRLPLKDQRPFFHVPPNAKWWENLVFGATSGLLALAIPVGIVSVLFLLPIVIPFKALSVYVLGPQASLLSAILAFPIVYATTSIAFTAVYIGLMVNQKGNLKRNDALLYSADGPWPFLEIYYFSLSTMVKGSPQYEATNWCRWVALAEVTVGRLLDVAIVTVGIGAILKRSLGVGPH